MRITNDSVIISKEEFLDLKLNAIRLERLNAGGVDNWEWYSESLHPEGVKSMDEVEEDLRKVLGL